MHSQSHEYTESATAVVGLRVKHGKFDIFQIAQTFGFQSSQVSFHFDWNHCF